MIIKNIFVIIFLLNVNHLCLQAQVNQEWVVFYDGLRSIDEPAGLAIDASGNIFVTGKSKVNSNEDFLTIKYNNSGETQWIQRYNGPGNNSDYPGAIALDGAGNVYVTGGSTQLNAKLDFATIKYSASGVQMWLQSYGGTGEFGSSATSIATYGSGIVYITGSTYNTGTSYDQTTIKYNSLGSRVWVQKKNGPINLDDQANALTTDNAGNVYVAGHISNSGQNTYDYSIIKYRSDGNELWSRYYNGTSDGFDYGYAVAVDNSGNVIITGVSYDIISNYDIVTVKYSSSGTLLWSKRYDAYYGSDLGYSVVTDDFLNVYVSGRSKGVDTESDMTIIKYNSSGDQQWVKRINGTANGNDFVYSMVKDSFNNIYVTGAVTGTGTLTDIVTIKYSGEGNELWNVSYNGISNGDDIPVAVRLDGDNNVIVSGKSYSDSTDFDYVTIKYSQTVGVNTISNQIPDKNHLGQNYPNPFNPRTLINYELRMTSDVKLKVYDILGNEVSTLVNEKQNAGSYEAEFDGSGLASGIYYYKLEAGGFVQTRSMVLVK